MPGSSGEKPYSIVTGGNKGIGAWSSPKRTRRRGASQRLPSSISTRTNHRLTSLYPLALGIGAGKRAMGATRALRRRGSEKTSASPAEPRECLHTIATSLERAMKSREQCAERGQSKSDDARASNVRPALRAVLLRRQGDGAWPDAEGLPRGHCCEGYNRVRDSQARS